MTPPSPPPPVAPTAATPYDGRLPFVDLLRALASQLVVWHHLAFYGPLSDAAYPLLPRITDWLVDYARMAVQVFFVLGGFFAAAGVERSPAGLRAMAGAVGKRYRRIGGPYLATLLLAVLANEAARSFMEHSSISAPPTLPQLAAHLFFLQDILGFEALTAGVWYLCIDFQLVLVLLVAGALARAGASAMRADSFLALQALLWPTAAASVFVFNRNPAGDVWWPYFFGSFFTGMLARWAWEGRVRVAYFGLWLAVLAGGLAVEWRPRLLLAGATASLVVLAGRAGLLQRWPRAAVVAYAGRVSYSLFLVHFPVCLVANALVWSRLPRTPAVGLAGMAAAWAASMGAAAVFHRFVERRFLAASSRGPSRGLPAAALPRSAGRLELR